MIKTKQGESVTVSSNARIDSSQCNASKMMPFVCVGGFFWRWREENFSRMARVGRVGAWPTRGEKHWSVQVIQLALSRRCWETNDLGEGFEAAAGLFHQQRWNWQDCMQRLRHSSTPKAELICGATHPMRLLLSSILRCCL